MKDDGSRETDTGTHTRDLRLLEKACNIRLG